MNQIIQRRLLTWVCLFALCAARPASGQMDSNDVARVLAQAATRAAQISTNSVIAVSDREGFVLGVWSLRAPPGAPDLAFTLDVLDAITKAGTASYLSSDQHAFTSRTAGFIVQQNFPPGVRNKPPGPLVGVNFSNMSFSDVNRFKDPSSYLPGQYGGGGTNGGPVAPLAAAAISGLAGSPGGVPLFKNGKLIGGVGVSGTTRGRRTGIPALDDIQAVQKRDIDEDVALAGQIGYAPAGRILGSHVFIDGIRVPYVTSATRLNTNTVPPLGSLGTNVAPYFLASSPPVNYPLTSLAGITGELRAPIIDDPVPGTINGQARLTADEVSSILGLAARRASITRAGIRLPRGQSAQVFISVVNNPDMDAVAPTILGTFRTPAATLFSWDVCVQKARTAVYFSRTNFPFIGTPIACSSRTVGFLAQRMYPPGIAHTSPGPLLKLQEIFSVLPRFDAFPLPIRVTNVLNGVFLTNDFMVDPALPNGITIFPGGFPLYRNGQLIGAIGVSGDGIDQDDIIAASGTVNFLPPQNIRADQFRVRGARLAYAKFPRNPSL